MAPLDELTGYEFEDLMVDVFRNLGYENVRRSARTADAGRDILMEESVDGRRRAVVVECKRTDTVSRPVVQKLHSAVVTYDYDGPVRGMVVTTGRFTGPAEEYARELGTRQGGGVELLDGADLREIGERTGMDLYNGRIEILCEEALEPVHPTAGPDAPVFEAVRGIENLEPVTIPSPETRLELEPTVTVTARASATFETSVGVIHRLDERSELVVVADRDAPRIAPDEITDLVGGNAPRLDLEGRDLETAFDAVERARFGQTQTEYKEWAIDRLRRAHTTTVHYTGDNNVDYEKTCTPNRPTSRSGRSIPSTFPTSARGSRWESTTTATSTTPPAPRGRRRETTSVSASTAGSTGRTRPTPTARTAGASTATTTRRRSDSKANPSAPAVR